MSKEFELKLLDRNHIGTAIERAEHYRLLNAPEQAESICLDILAIDEDNQQALVLLVLAMTDQLGTMTSTPIASVQKLLPRLTDEYQRVYYEGLTWEREAYALLDRGPSRMYAYDRYRRAMACYERADALSDESNDDPILRWNSCARTIARKKLEPLPDEELELGLE